MIERLINHYLSTTCKDMKDIEVTSFRQYDGDVYVDYTYRYTNGMWSDTKFEDDCTISLLSLLGWVYKEIELQ